MTFCPSCGKKVGDDWKICQHCGAKLKGLGSAATPQKESGGSSKLKWIVLGVVVLVVLGFVALIVLGVGGYFLYAGDDGSAEVSQTVEGDGELDVVCNPPYIVDGDGCCLDRDGSGVCDADETPLEESTTSVTTTSTAPETTVEQTTTSTAPATTVTTTLATTTVPAGVSSVSGFTGLEPKADTADLRTNAFSIRFENTEGYAIRPTLIYSQESASSQLCTPPPNFNDEVYPPGEELYLTLSNCLEYESGKPFRFNIRIKYEPENGGTEKTSAGYISGRYP